MTTEFVINHLWQSSFAALLAGLLAFVLRANSPRVRYWVWLSASVKFLVPLALLVNLGGMISRPTPRATSGPPPAFASALVQIAEPFAPPVYSTAPAEVPVRWVPIVAGVAWALGLAVIAFVRCRSWLRIRSALRASTPARLPIPIPAFLVPGAEEPGLVGFLRPVLVLPTNLLEQLNSQQLEAVLAHELCHARRKDNFFAGVHMVVEAIFWFHPLVWWIGSRMIEERELACDEEVLRTGCEPADYVEGILTVCRLYKESPLPCVTGVTGANVKMRLRAILAGNTPCELTIAKKAALAAIGAAVLTVPAVIGVFNVPRVKAQSTAQPRQPALPAPPLVAQAAAPQASQQPAPSAGFPIITSSSFRRVDRGTPWTFPHRIGAQEFEAVSTVAQLIQWAYGLGRDFQVSGGPGWLGAPYFDSSGVRGWPEYELFEVHATAERSSSDAEMKQIVQMLLANFFKLELLRETKSIPIYAIVAGPQGPNLPPETEPESCPVPRGECGFPNIGGPEGGAHTIIASGATMSGFASLLTNNVDRPVVDKTGLTGGYSFILPYDHSGPGWRTGPAIFTAIQTLGLRLEPQTETIEVVVIDSAERPQGR